MTRNNERPRTHPGAILREDVLPASGLSKAAFARALGVSRQTLYDIINETQPVTPAMAVRIGRLCGNGGRFWSHMQNAYDLWQAERDVDVSNIKPLEMVG